MSCDGYKYTKDTMYYILYYVRIIVHFNVSLWTLTYTNLLDIIQPLLSVMMRFLLFVMCGFVPSLRCCKTNEIVLLSSLVFLSPSLCCGPVGRAGSGGEWKSRRIH